MATRSFACGESAASVTTGSDPYSPFCPGMSVVPPPGQRSHCRRRSVPWPATAPRGRQHTLALSRGFQRAGRGRAHCQSHRWKMGTEVQKSFIT